jgi:hypothetical protein
MRERADAPMRVGYQLSKRRSVPSSPWLMRFQPMSATSSHQRSSVSSEKTTTDLAETWTPCSRASRFRIVLTVGK